MGTAGSIAVVLLIICLLLFIAIPDIVTCPQCHGYGKYVGWIPGLRCPTCDGDGQVTILQFITYSIEHPEALEGIMP